MSTEELDAIEALEAEEIAACAARDDSNPESVKRHLHAEFRLTSALRKFAVPFIVTLRKVMGDRDDLLRACEAVLLFYKPGEWGEPERKKMEELTGSEVCSTKTLCDFVREVMKKAGVTT